MLFHWLGDFVLQTDKQAKLKSKDAGVLWSHVFTWTGSVTIGLILYVFYLAKSSSYVSVDLFYWICFVASTHYLVDMVTSRINAYAQQTGKIKLFWTVIGLDQWLHLALLLWASEYFLKL